MLVDRPGDRRRQDVLPVYGFVAALALGSVQALRHPYSPWIAPALLGRVHARPSSTGERQPGQRPIPTIRQHHPPAFGHYVACAIVGLGRAGGGGGGLQVVKLNAEGFTAPGTSTHTLSHAHHKH